MMDKTWIIDIGKMIEMLIPLCLFAAAAFSLSKAQIAKKAECRIPIRARKSPRTR